MNGESWLSPSFLFSLPSSVLDVLVFRGVSCLILIVGNIELTLTDLVYPMRSTPSKSAPKLLHLQWQQTGLWTIRSLKLPRSVLHTLAGNFGSRPGMFIHRNKETTQLTRPHRYVKRELQNAHDAEEKRNREGTEMAKNWARFSISKTGVTTSLTSEML